MGPAARRALRALQLLLRRAGGRRRGAQGRARRPTTSPSTRARRSSSGAAARPSACCAGAASGARCCSSEPGRARHRRPRRGRGDGDRGRARPAALAAGGRAVSPVADQVGPWLDEAERAPDPGSELVPLARDAVRLAGARARTLVHGDLHHHNILAAGDRHLAIDPKPMLGEPEYDVASFLWNPIGSELDLEVTRAAAGRVRRRRPRPAPDARLGGDPRRLSRRRRARGRDPAGAARGGPA